MSEKLADAIERLTGSRPLRRSAMGGGCIGEVFRIDLANGARVVAKRGSEGSGLALEGWMLDYLKRNSRLPVPAVLHASDALLLMEYIETGSVLDAAAQTHGAEILAELHNINAPRYGLERDTLIGGLHQPNPETSSWIAFFRDQRLLYMGGEAMGAGRLPGALMKRIERFAERLDKWIAEPACASLIHGDMWGGNVLTARGPRGGRIAAFVDPAIYYADPEIELAFSTMFSTFGDPFFRRYREIRPIRPGFFEERLDIYNLYPLLVHVRLFGGGYLGGVERTLSRFGF